MRNEKVAEGHVSRACIRGVCRAAHGSGEIPEIVALITRVLPCASTANCIRQQRDDVRFHANFATSLFAHIGPSNRAVDTKTSVSQKLPFYLPEFSKRYRAFLVCVVQILGYN